MSTAGMPGRAKRNTTRPSPTSTRPSDSTRDTPPPTSTAAASGWPRRTTTRPSPTSTKPPARSKTRRLQQPRRSLAAKKEYDKATADFNEAIRLDPKYPTAYNNRGLVCGQARIRQGHRRFQRGHQARPEIHASRTATAAAPGTLRRNTTRRSPTSTRPSDSTPNTPSPTTTAAAPGERRRSTTRPSPTSTRPSGSTRIHLAYINRGSAWHAKKEYNKAIADYTEAIRLDPKDACLLRNRGDRLA